MSADDKVLKKKINVLNIKSYLLELSEEIDELKKTIKEIENNEKEQENQNELIRKQINENIKCYELLLEKVDDIEKNMIDTDGFEECTREQFEEHQQMIRDINDREEWTRKQFEEHQQMIRDINDREEWTRKQFEEHQQMIRDINDREEWTRKQFEEHQQMIKDINDREEWTRNQFELNNTRVHKLEKEIEKASCTNILGYRNSFYDKKTYSQTGEDSIIAYILRFMGYDMSSIRYMDLGANHAIEMSNSYYFYSQGSSGILLEANPALVDELKEYRTRDVIVNKALAFEGCSDTIDFYVLSGDGLSTIDKNEAEAACITNPDIYIKGIYKIPTITVNKIFEKYYDDGIQILSIDLEGIEEKILSEIDFSRYRPLIIVVEDIPYSPRLVYGKKENKVKYLLERNSYVEYAFTGINAIYIDSIAVNKFNEKIKVGK